MKIDAIIRAYNGADALGLAFVSALDAALSEEQF